MYVCLIVVVGNIDIYFFFKWIDRLFSCYFVFVIEEREDKLILLFKFSRVIYFV